MKKTGNKKPAGKIGKKELEWRRKQKRGAIMKPSTFSQIEKSAAHKKGVKNPEAVAGAAYWNAEKAKYKKAQARKRKVKSRK